MIQYRFKIGVNTNRVWLENDEEANEFSKFIDANWERDTMIVKLQQDNKFCTFELELGDIKNAEIIRNLKFKNINIWVV